LLQHVVITINAGGTFSGKRELALMLEDDLSVSKFSYRWLRAVDNAYGKRTEYGGASLQSDELLSMADAGPRRGVVGPKNDTVFMYKIISSWGFAPDPTTWRHFQVRATVNRLSELFVSLSCALLYAKHV